MSKQKVSATRDGSVLEIRPNNPENCYYMIGEGPTFCSGGELKMMMVLRDPWLQVMPK